MDWMVSIFRGQTNKYRLPHIYLVLLQNTTLHLILEIADYNTKKCKDIELFSNRMALHHISTDHLTIISIKNIPKVRSVTELFDRTTI